MGTRVRRVTIAALMTALAVVLLYVGNLIPAGRLALPAVSSLFVAAAVIEAGLPPAVFVFASGGLLGWLIVPDKSPTLLFLLFFGYYPIVKSLAERLRPAFLGWLLKLVVFNAALFAVWFLFRYLLYDALPADVHLALVALAGSAVFIIFDIGLSRLIGLYISRISKYIRKNNR